MTERTEKPEKPLTGRHVLAIACGAFACIIAANLTLAYNAVQSFPGIEVANGYVASQRFEAERAAQARLGWGATARYERGRLTVALADRAGGVPPVERMRVRLGRPTTEAVDLTPVMTWTTRGWTADLALDPGLWRVDVVAEGPAGEPFRQHLVVEVLE